MPNLIEIRYVVLEMKHVDPQTWRLSISLCFHYMYKTKTELKNFTWNLMPNRTRKQVRHSVILNSSFHTHAYTMTKKHVSSGTLRSTCDYVHA